MPEPLTFCLVLAAALAAGTIGGTVGFGSAIVLVPVLAAVFGPMATVPILTIASVLGNASRAAFSWREIDWRCVAWYGLGGIPAAALGARLFVAFDAELVQRLLGVFIIAAVPAGRFAARLDRTLRPQQLLPVGACMGFLSGLVGATGPISAPFFLAAGLMKGAYIGTEALGALAVHATKSVVYGRFAALDARMIAAGLAIGLMLAAGSFLGRRIVERLDIARFRLAVEIMLIVSGLLMLLGP